MPQDCPRINVSLMHRAQESTLCGSYSIPDGIRRMALSERGLKLKGMRHGCAMAAHLSNNATTTPFAYNQRGM